VVGAAVGKGAGEVVARMPGVVMMRLDGPVLPENPFGARALFAISNSGLIAQTDGLEYCIGITGYRGDRVERWCREWDRTPVSGRAYDPGLPEELGMSERDAEFFRRRAERQVIPEQMQSISDIWFDRAGRLWVRVVGPEHVYDPMIEGPHPETRPHAYSWEVFDDGELIRQYHIDSRTRPLAVLGGVLVAMGEADTGERGLVFFDIDLD
jgi:hypothetical protein